MWLTISTEGSRAFNTQLPVIFFKKVLHENHHNFSDMLNRSCLDGGDEILFSLMYLIQEFQSGIFIYFRERAKGEAEEEGENKSSSRHLLPAKQGPRLQDSIPRP